MVHGVDTNVRAVEMINRGAVHIYEPDLDTLVKEVVSEGRLVASLKPTVADVFILAVPTPFRSSHQPDLSYVEAGTRSIAPYLRPGCLVVLESTSPVGTTELVADLLRELRPDLSIPERNSEAREAGQVYIAHCPERVLPGSILKELVENDRMVGGIDAASTEVARDFYRLFVNGNIAVTDSRTAEMCKLTENSYRDVNIAFANELALICEKLEIDVWELINLANRHPRVNILQPGPGVGGHCIAVDPWFIISAAPDEARLIRTAREVNDGKPLHVLKKIQSSIAGISKPVVACLGLAFKANIDDLRESPALKIVQLLSQDEQLSVVVAEPHISQLPPQLVGHSNVSLCDADAAIGKADVVVLLVDHQQFRDIDVSSLSGKTVIDTRGMWRCH